MKEVVHSLYLRCRIRELHTVGVAVSIKFHAVMVAEWETMLAVYKFNTAVIARTAAVEAALWRIDTEQSVKGGNR